MNFMHWMQRIHRPTASSAILIGDSRYRGRLIRDCFVPRETPQSLTLA